MGNEPYLRDSEGAGKCGTHRHHPKKGVWSIFQGLHHGQAVRKQQAGSETERIWAAKYCGRGLTPSREDAPRKGGSTHSSISTISMRICSWARCRRSRMCWMSSAGREVTVESAPPRGPGGSAPYPSLPRLTYEVLALLRVDPDHTDLQLG